MVLAGPAGVAWSAEEEEEEWGVAELDAQHRERRAHAHLLPRQLHQPQHQHQHQQHQQEEVKEEEEEEEEEEQEQERGGAGTGVEELLLVWRARVCAWHVCAGRELRVLPLLCHVRVACGARLRSNARAMCAAPRAYAPAAPAKRAVLTKATRCGAEIGYAVRY
eukprot:3079403-Rhodomonas_salina.2